MQELRDCKPALSSRKCRREIMWELLVAHQRWFFIGCDSHDSVPQLGVAFL